MLQPVRSRSCFSLAAAASRKMASSCLAAAARRLLPFSAQLGSLPCSAVTNARAAAAAAATRTPFACTPRRCFSIYEGQPVTSDELLKKTDDWVIEETNFCLGRVAPVRFKETDDLAHRVLHLMDAQLPKMHTRLRDGTCIPVMGLYIPCVCDKPTPLHQCLEAPLLKWTWDHVYSEAYEDSTSSVVSSAGSTVSTKE